MAPPSVTKDKARHDFHNKIWEARRLGKIAPYIADQLLHQNISQAEWGNPLPVKGGDEMLTGNEISARATTYNEIKRGHEHAQLASLHGAGFRGAASVALHHAAVYIQRPAYAMRSAMFGPQQAMHGPYPLLSATRWMGAKYYGAKGQKKEEPSGDK